MKFDDVFRIGDIISILGFTVACVGLFLNWSQLRKNNVRERAAFIDKLFNQYLNDADATSMFYDVIYDRFNYDSKTFYGSIIEIKLDKLLTYFEKIARLHEMGVFKIDDLDLVEFEFLSVSQNVSVKRYLDDLSNLAHEQNLKGVNFTSFRRVAEQLTQRQSGLQSGNLIA